MKQFKRLKVDCVSAKKLKLMAVNNDTTIINAFKVLLNSKNEKDIFIKKKERRENEMRVRFNY